MLRKVTPIMAAILGASFLLTACNSKKKENTAKATEKNETNQSISFTVYSGNTNC